MEIRWKLHCEVMATHVPTQAFQKLEKFKIGRSRNFHVPKKLGIANFNRTSNPLIVWNNPFGVDDPFIASGN